MFAKTSLLVTVSGRWSVIAFMVVLLILDCGAFAEKAVPAEASSRPPLKMSANPYNSQSFETGESAVLLNPELVENVSRKATYQHFKAKSEWIYPEMANILLAQSRLYTLEESPWYRSAPLLENIEAFFSYLEAKGYDDRWYHLERGMGDRNVDRFTLLPLIEAFLLMRDSLDPSLQAALLAKIKGVLEVQFREYGMEGKEFKRVYPNMDVFYCAIMHHGYRLTGDDRFQAEFLRSLDHLANAQFEDGGWTYIDGANECAVYHDINVVVMARIFQLSQHEKAWAQLQKCIPYYPMTVAPGGVMENHTDCWWKHSKKRISSAGPDIISSLTGDGQNRWIGDQARAWKKLREPSKATHSNISDLIVYYASLLWKEVQAEPIPANRIFYDANIQGPRGHMDGWSWAATGRFACDTVVGATVHTGPGEAVQSLMAITPGVPYLPPGHQKGVYANDVWDLAMIPQGVKGTTRIEGGKAIYEVTYQLACGHYIWGKPAFPLQWNCHQYWEMDGKRMVGRIKVISLSQQSSSPPTIRIRFGEGHHLKQTSDTTFSYGRLKLSVEPKDFPKSIQREAPIMVSHAENNADELVFFSEVKTEFSPNDEFNFDVTVEFDADSSQK